MFQASTLYMTNTGITMDNGYIQAKDNVNILGASETTPDATVQLTFSSAGLFTILTGSKLFVGPDIWLYYSPNTANDGGVASVQKRHFYLTDPSSTLWLSRAHINAGTTGMGFDRGKIVIDDYSNINTSYNAGYEFELGSAVNLTILQGATFNINGQLKYISTSYP